MGSGVGKARSPDELNEVLFAARLPPGIFRRVTSAYRKAAKIKLPLTPEERLALDEVLELNSNEELRLRQMHLTVQEGIDAIDRGDCLAIDSSDDLNHFLESCFDEAARRVRATD